MNKLLELMGYKYVNYVNIQSLHQTEPMAKQGYSFRRMFFVGIGIPWKQKLYDHEPDNYSYMWYMGLISYGPEA